MSTFKRILAIGATAAFFLLFAFYFLPIGLLIAACAVPVFLMYGVAHLIHHAKRVFTSKTSETTPEKVAIVRRVCIDPKPTVIPSPPVKSGLSFFNPATENQPSEKIEKNNYRCIR